MRYLYKRTCTSCDTEFETPNFRKNKCRKNCRREEPNKARHHKLFAGLEFVGVDGEGVGRPDGAHDYVMLSVGDQTLVKDDGSQLSYADCFEFLYAEFRKKPHAAFVGFYLKYDFIQWTKTLPEDRAYQLWSPKGQAGRKPTKRKNPDPFPVVHDGWEFDILASRRFRLRPHVCRKKQFADACAGCNRPLGIEDIGAQETSMEPENSEQTIVTNVEGFWGELKNEIKAQRQNSWMYICDTGPFWQSSFMTAIKPSAWPIPVCTPDEYATIKQGKETRDKLIAYGDTTDYEEMRMYNILENDILARMTTVLCKGFDAIGIKVAGREWYGPGRAAQLWLTDVSKRMGEGNGFDRLTITESIPAYALDAGRKCYYGGWFEQFIHGHIPGTTFEYDINSAYPYIISTLPCLLHGTWATGNGIRVGGSRSSYTMWNATVRGSDPYIGAMPYRSKQGRILRPRHVTGWYWEHEIEASQRAGLIDTVDVHEWVSYDPCLCEPPLRAIADLYQERLRVDKGSPQGRGYKLVYNSSYGKMAQSIGEPKFANSVYASLITAGCRTLILDAIASHPDKSSAVTMVATDGVYFTSKHPSVPLSATELGKWDVQCKENLTQFMPGVYWDDKTRDSISVGGLPKLKSRGINASDLARNIAALDGAFLDMAKRVALGDPAGWPVFDISTSFEIVSCSQALQRRRWTTAGVVTKGKIRKINSDPIRKRQSVPYPDGNLLRTRPYGSDEPLQSVPYDKSFGQELADLLLQEESVTPDGDNGDLLAWMLSGVIDA